MMQEDEADARASFEADYPSNMHLRRDDGKYMVTMMELSWQIFSKGWTARDKQLATKILAAQGNRVNSMGYSYSIGDATPGTYQLKIEKD
jgi:hypothetical protein